MLALVIALTASLAITAAFLAEIRTGNGTWSSTFADADLSGLPVVARGVAAFTIGVLVGAIVGRTLPAFLVSVAVVVGLAMVLASLQAGAVDQFIDQTSVGAPGAAGTFLRRPTDLEVRLVTADFRVLTLDQALADAPTSATDKIAWVADHDQLVTFGVKGSLTFGWQLRETLLLSALALGLASRGASIIARRSPR